MEDVEEVGQFVPTEQPAQVLPGKKINQFINVRLLSSPWLLLSAPLVFGAVWLANHTDVITSHLNEPYALAVGPVIAGSILLLWITINFFKTITVWCRSAWTAFQAGRKADGSAQFFWLVIIVFMIVSVFASGNFFNTLEHDALPGLGYITALFIDLVAVQSMRARLNAVRMRDKRGAGLYLFGVLVCASASAFANVFTSLAQFAVERTGALPMWMLQVAPWFGLVFPALILLLSMTADYTLDQVSTKLDPEQYKAQEEKRTKMLIIQRDALKERALLEQEIDSYSKKKREKRVFFLYALLFPVAQHTQSFEEVLQNVLVDFSKTYQEDMQNFQATFTQSLQKVVIKEPQSFEEVLPPPFQNLLPELPESLEKDTDPTLQKFSESLGRSFSKDNQNIAQTFEEVNEDVYAELPKSSGPTTGELSRNFSDVLSLKSQEVEEKLHKTTGKLSLDLLKTFCDNPQEVTRKPESNRRNAITKIEASSWLKCNLEDIETSIKNGQIKMYGNSKDKVLVSSLRDFIPPKKRKSKV